MRENGGPQSCSLTLPQKSLLWGKSSWQYCQNKVVFLSLPSLLRQGEHRLCEASSAASPSVSMTDITNQSQLFLNYLCLHPLCTPPPAPGRQSWLIDYRQPISSPSPVCYPEVAHLIFPMLLLIAPFCSWTSHSSSIKWVFIFLNTQSPVYGWSGCSLCTRAPSQGVGRAWHTAQCLFTKLYTLDWGCPHWVQGAFCSVYTKALYILVVICEQSLALCLCSSFCLECPFPIILSSFFWVLLQSLKPCPGLVASTATSLVSLSHDSVHSQPYIRTKWGHFCPYGIVSVLSLEAVCDFPGWGLAQPPEAEVHGLDQTRHF